MRQVPARLYSPRRAVFHGPGKSTTGQKCGQEPYFSYDPSDSRSCYTDLYTHTLGLQRIMEKDVDLKSIARWIAVLPGAVTAAWLAYYLTAPIDPNAFFSGADFLSHACMGLAFVYVGAKIAPRENKVAGYVLSGFGLVLVGFLTFPAFLVRDYWAMSGGLIFGFGLAIYGIQVGKIKIEP